MHGKSTRLLSAPERFWAKVQKTDGCWPWTAARLTAGYGVFCPSGGNNVSAHRYAWELTRGPIPDGLFVLHHCDNPPCVRPDHLFLGTQADNMADRVAKGHVVRGDQHGNTKVRSADVQIILARLIAGESQASIARDYPISPSRISRLRKRHGIPSRR